MENKNSFIDNLQISRQSLMEIVVSAFILAFGVNLLSAFFTTTYHSYLIYFGVIGAVCCFGSILFFIYQITDKRIEKSQYQAFFIYNRVKNRIESVPNYGFSEQMKDYMVATFVENINLRNFWNNRPLEQAFPSHPENPSAVRKNSIKFVNELVECIILYRLSTHLEDFFNQTIFVEDNLKIFQRSDLPTILLQNRFLETISHPINERPHFDSEEPENPATGELISCSGDDGALFEKFKLTLPKNCKITKPTENEIIIDTEKINIVINVDFQGFNADVPEEFLECYLKIDNYEDFSKFLVIINIQITIKFRAFFSGSGWEYYKWVDSFRSDLDSFLSQKYFFEKINWNTVYTILHCLKNIENDVD
jgi:hypothetical protein